MTATAKKTATRKMTIGQRQAVGYVFENCDTTEMLNCVADLLAASTAARPKADLLQQLVKTAAVLSSQATTAKECNLALTAIRDAANAAITQGANS